MNNEVIHVYFLSCMFFGVMAYIVINLEHSLKSVYRCSIGNSHSLFVFWCGSRTRANYVCDNENDGDDDSHHNNRYGEQNIEFTIDMYVRIT